MPTDLLPDPLSSQPIEPEKWHKLLQDQQKGSKEVSSDGRMIKYIV